MITPMAQACLSVCYVCIVAKISILPENCLVM